MGRGEGCMILNVYEKGCLEELGLVSLNRPQHEGEICGRNWLDRDKDALAMFYSGFLNGRWVVCQG
jgi:hypothetical protein